MNHYNLPKILGSYRFGVDLSKTTWFGVGGKAEILFRPADAADLAQFLQEKPADLSITILGACSNVIIKDAGIAGVVIKLGREFAGIKHYEATSVQNYEATSLQNIGSLNHENAAPQILEIGAGALCSNAALYCKINGLGGLEFLSGIPGAIGGAIAMNAGCYGGDVASTLISAQAVDYSGNIFELSNAEMGFEYRKNKLSGKYIFIGAKFRAISSSSAEVGHKISELTLQRETAQPIRSKTGGSTFKNPLGNSAWKLIDEAGCRGLTLGDAQISEKHCNFMINRGHAKASDLIDLGNQVIDRVLQKTGVKLEWEIKIIGK